MSSGRAPFRSERADSAQHPRRIAGRHRRCRRRPHIRLLSPRIRWLGPPVRPFTDQRGLTPVPLDRFIRAGSRSNPPTRTHSIRRECPFSRIGPHQPFRAIGRDVRAGPDQKHDGPESSARGRRLQRPRDRVVSSCPRERRWRSSNPHLSHSTASEALLRDSSFRLRDELSQYSLRPAIAAYPQGAGGCHRRVTRSTVPIARRVVGIRWLARCSVRVPAFPKGSRRTVANGSFHGSRRWSRSWMCRSRLATWRRKSRSGRSGTAAVRAARSALSRARPSTARSLPGACLSASISRGCRPRVSGVPVSMAQVCRPFPAPVPGEIFDGLVDVVGDRVYLGDLAGAAHGDVSEFSAAAIGEEMGSLERQTRRSGSSRRTAPR